MDRDKFDLIRYNIPDALWVAAFYSLIAFILGLAVCSFF